jgi:hypothetical protein
MRLPDSLSSLGSAIFSGDDHLMTVTNWNERLTEIPDSMFAGTDLINFEIPNGITRIGSHAFSQTLMRDVVIPDSVTTIGDRAFYECYNLRSVTFGKNVKGSIAPFCFYRCLRLEKIEIPDKITSIEVSAFRDCFSLGNVKFSKKLKKIKESAFEGCNLLAVTFPDTVTSIGPNAFKDNGTLTYVTFGSNVKTIKKSVFSGCTSLWYVYVPKDQYKRYKELLKEPLTITGQVQNVKIKKLK